MRTAFLRCPSLLQTSIAVLTFLDVYFTLLDMQLVRGSSLTGFIPLIAAHGGDPAAVLVLADLDADDIGQRDRHISLRSAIGAVETAATMLNVLDFGRQLATRQDIDVLGPVGVAARTAATVADAFAILDTYMGAYSPGIAIRIASHPDPGLCRLEYDFLLNPAPPQAQAIELALGVTLRVMHLFLGTAYHPVAVHLPHPALGTKTDYRRYFGCPPLFNELVSGFTMRATDLQRPLSHDPLAHQLAMTYLSTAFGDSTRGLAHNLCNVIRQLLPSGRLTSELAARHFGLHSKTLQRRLAAEHTTYAALVDHTRREVAHRLLLDTNLSLRQICHQLGYAEQSVLTRSCKRWFNATPSAYRSLGHRS